MAPRLSPPKEKLPDFIVFCDGASSGNPGPGGWGAIVLDVAGGEVEELGGHVPETTNNRMELAGAIRALGALEGRDGDVWLYTDSTYVIRGITQWIWGWQKRGWRTAEGKDVSNADLWKALAPLVRDRKPRGELAWKYVRGHAGVPGNERVDAIAVDFSKRRRATLYAGPLRGYPHAVMDLPPDAELPEMKSREQTAPKTAHSYLSLVGGVVERHSTWKECEARVKGRPGVKFKKAMSAADETAILAEWGVKPPRG
jgi:ribonuclease HI